MNIVKTVVREYRHSTLKHLTWQMTRNIKMHKLITWRIKTDNDKWIKEFQVFIWICKRKTVHSLTCCIKGLEYNSIQMMHGCKWNIQMCCPKVDMSTRRCSPSGDISTEGQHIWMFHEQPCFICFVVWPTTSRYKIWINNIFTFFTQNSLV